MGLVLEADQDLIDTGKFGQQGQLFGRQAWLGMSDETEAKAIFKRKDGFASRPEVFCAAKPPSTAVKSALAQGNL